MPNNSIESTQITFEEANEIFGDRKIEVGGKVVNGLGEVLDQTVLAHARWGLVDRMDMTVGVYKSLLEGVSVDRVNIMNAMEMVREDIITAVPIFDAGRLSPFALWRVLFEDTPIRSGLSTSGVTNETLRALKHVGLDDFELGIFSLSDLNQSGVLQAFKAAFEKSSKSHVDTPRLLFTGDVTNCSFRSVAIRLEEGERFTDINTEILYCRTYMDRLCRLFASSRNEDIDGMTSVEFNALLATYWSNVGREDSLNGMPNSNSIIVCPNSVVSNGFVLDISFSQDDSFQLGAFNPGFSRFPSACKLRKLA